ncbi:MAG: hypothetical protein IKQ46_09350 [Bacteroidales bacterium]|nr:hypothetical protein [Bacteroidales bacterium]
MKRLLVLSCLLFLCFDTVNAQKRAAYKKLSKPERQWVRRHPFAALKAFPISKTVSKEANQRLTDPDLDGDGNGGMVDAFRHTLWMSLNSQAFGKRKAILLGIAHEKSNRLDFEAHRLEDGDIPDSVMCEMDLRNNEIGASLGRKYKNYSYDEMVKLVKSEVIAGNCWKVKKDSQKKYLDTNGEVIDRKKYQGNWHVPKVLIKSNK